MKLIIDIDKELKSAIYNCGLFLNPAEKMSLINAINNGTPIHDNATNGDVIEAMFGDDKVSEFMCHTRIIAKVGNWLNEGVVAEFDNVWLNAPYQKGCKE